MPTARRCYRLALAASMLLGCAARAEPAGEATTPSPDSQAELERAASAGDAEALAKEAQNPIANLISLPVQWNATPQSQWAPRLVDPAARHQRTFNVWNVQPVVPLPLGERLSLVGRVIVPVVQRPLAGASEAIGLGDINPSLFLVPRGTGRWTVGAGPTAVLPTATDRALGSRRWSAGPAAVAVYTRGPWVAGSLVTNVWSFAGTGQREVNAMLVQPFVNYNLPQGWYITTSPILTNDWTVERGKGWTVPLGAGIGRLFRMGDQPFNASLHAYANVVQPKVLGERLLGDLTLRLQIQALFPIRR
ncbi:MAG: neuromedin U [Cyanobacteriota bacterium]|nr:neuromedin U [Cyanobacteriota bacterium]